MVSTLFCPQLNRMRRFLQDSAVASGSGIPQPERDDGYIEVEGLDYEVQETASDVEPMIADQSSSIESTFGCPQRNLMEFCVRCRDKLTFYLFCQ